MDRPSPRARLVLALANGGSNNNNVRWGGGINNYNGSLFHSSQRHCLFCVYTNLGRLAGASRSPSVRFGPTADRMELTDIGVGSHLDQVRLHQLRAVLGADGADAENQIARLRPLVGEHDAFSHASHGSRTPASRISSRQAPSIRSVWCCQVGLRYSIVQGHYSRQSIRDSDRRHL
jgi:hypothetical protein